MCQSNASQILTPTDPAEPTILFALPRSRSSCREVASDAVWGSSLLVDQKWPDWLYRSGGFACPGPRSHEASVQGRAGWGM